MKRIVSVWGLVFVVILMVVGLGVPQLQADDFSVEQAEPLVSRLYVEDREHLAAVAGELDIWTVNYDAGFAQVAVTPDQVRWLESLGYHLEPDPDGAVLMGPHAPLDPRFYYFDNDYANANGLYIVDFLQATNAAYPNLTELIDIGDGWQTSHGGHQRDIWVMRITNENPTYGDVEDKPVFFMLGTTHAREVTIPELAIRYIKYLTAGYGGEGGYNIDPDVTWLVDHHVVYILVMQNPDGHRVNEASTSAYRRKNMDNDDGCSLSSSWGTDLNRNHSFFWNQGGSSGNPCAETYRGPSAASEPETHAFQNFFATVIRDQNGDNGDLELPPAAPDDATGIFISLHSWSDLVLWPWGHTYSPAPNGTQLQTIGRRFAYHNGYEPDQGSGLYPASGTTDDWTYGKFGIASFLFEVGPNWPSSSQPCEGFFVDYTCIDTPGPDGQGNFWPENKPTFIYAHKIARTPYLTAAGPDTVGLVVSSSLSPMGTGVELTATIDETRYSNAHGVEPTQNIATAEYYIDVPPWVTATTPISYPLAAEDGAFDEPVESVEAFVDTSGLSLGRHTIFVRGQDADGNWGAFTAVFFTVTSGIELESITVEVSPDSIPIGGGQAMVTATLVLSDGMFAPGWPVTFTTDSGTVAPVQTYSSAGGRAVTTLTSGEISGTAHITAQFGLISGTATVEFYVPDAPIAGFVSNSPVCSGTAAVFTNTSSGPLEVPTIFLWHFGDGTTSALESPEPYLYKVTGAFTVTLMASNAGGSDVYSDAVTVEPRPVAGFAFSPLNPDPGQQVQFSGNSSGVVLEWDWSFGDGGIASTPAPSHTFATTGTYTVALRTRADCGWSKPYQRILRVGLASMEYQYYVPLATWP